MSYSRKEHVINWIALMYRNISIKNRKRNALHRKILQLMKLLNMQCFDVYECSLSYCFFFLICVLVEVGNHDPVGKHDSGK